MNKILVILPDMNVGGITSSAINLMEVLSERGYDVSFLDMSSSSFSDTLKNRKYEILGVRKYWNLSHIDKRNFLSIIFTVFLALVKKILNKFGCWYSFIFYNYMLPEKYDVVIAYRQCEPCYYFALHCVDAKRKIGMIHGNIDYMGNIKSWSKYFSDFNYLVCVSRAVSSGFKKVFPMYKNKFVTVYNMFNVDLIRERAFESLNFSIDSNMINIVSVTRQENGHKQAQRIPIVCSLLKQRGYLNIHWYVVGEGPDYDYNKNLAKTLEVDNMITYCGALSNPFPIIKKCDFLVLTSKTEAFPMVLKEAQILGKPVVAMRYPGIEESFDDGITGYVAEQSVESLCDKIELLVINNFKNLNRMIFNIGKIIDFNEIALNQFVSLLN